MIIICYNIQNIIFHWEMTQSSIFPSAVYLPISANIYPIFIVMDE